MWEGVSECGFLGVVFCGYACACVVFLYNTGRASLCKQRESITGGAEGSVRAFKSTRDNGTACTRRCDRVSRVRQLSTERA